MKKPNNTKKLSNMTQLANVKKIAVGTSVAALMLSVAACGGSKSVDVNADNKSNAPKTKLVVEVTTADKEVKKFDVECGPDKGTVKNLSASCAALTEEALAPVGKDQACTMQIDGPETAVITGTLNGKEVKAEFSRNNGCEISRWALIEKMTGIGADDSSK